MDQFVEQLRQVSPLSDEIVGQLLEEMKEVSFAKGELSIREGERDPFVWFVKTGLVGLSWSVRKDISLWFASDSEVINFVYRNISAYNVQMVENTTLLRIPKTKLDYLCRSSLELANWGLKIQDYYLREYENYFINDSWMEAREQYESLLKTRPDLILKLPLKHIASYLQITPQSLSRIRASVKNREKSLFIIG